MSANSQSNSLPPVPEAMTGPWPDWFRPVVPWLVMMARVINAILRGKVNVRATVTLTASATSTTITDDRIGPSSHIGLMPLTANATTVLPYVSSQGSGTATIHHGSVAYSDLQFSVLIIG